MVLPSHTYMTTGKIIALTIQTFVSKMMSLMFNILPRFLIVFLPRNKCLLMSWLQSLFTVILESKKISLPPFPHFHYLPGSDGTRCHDLSFFNVVFSQFFHSPLSPSPWGSLVPLSAITVVLSAYSKLLICLPAILIPACDSSSLAFHMMYPAYKLNKQDDNMQPWGTPFPIWNQSTVSHLVLALASWPA